MRKHDVDDYKLMDSFDVIIRPHLDAITFWREQGINVSKVCRKLGISNAMFYRFMKTNQELYDAWYSGSIGLLLDLEETLFREAKGYKYVEKTVQDLEDKHGVVYARKIIKTTKYHFPQMPALMRALETLHGQKWKVQDVESKDITITLKGGLEDYSK